jgi:UPF0176 protein
MNGCCSHECKDFVSLPVELQKERRKGLDKGRNIFNKSKQRILTIHQDPYKDPNSSRL